MSDTISWILEVAIHPGKLDDFRSVAADLIAATRNESGTLAYEYHLSKDAAVCHIYERYQDAEAVLTHLKSFGAFARRFMESCHPTLFYVYGTPTEELKAALADLNPIYFSLLGGFTR